MTNPLVREINLVAALNFIKKKFPEDFKGIIKQSKGNNKKAAELVISLLENLINKELLQTKEIFEIWLLI